MGVSGTKSICAWQSCVSRHAELCHVHIQGLADESEEEQWDADEEANHKHLGLREKASQSDSEQQGAIAAYYPAGVSANGSKVSQPYMSVWILVTGCVSPRIIMHCFDKQAWQAAIMDGLLLLLQQGTAKIVEQLRSRLETSLQKLQADELDEPTKEEVSIGTCRVQM